MVRTLTLIIGLLVSLAASPAFGQAASETEIITATFAVAPVAKLNLSALSLTFPDTNPDLAPLVPASGGPLVVTARTRATPGTPVTLTVQALDDLRSGTDVIPASAVRWTATGDGFADGALSAAAAQTVATWPASGAYTGRLEFVFENAWTWPTGTYSLTMVFTLTAL